MGTENLVRIDGKMNAAKYKRPWTQTCLHLPESLNWGGSSSFSRTMTQSTQPEEPWSDFKCRKFVSLSGLVSPDFNLIKHLQQDLKIAIHHRPQINLAQLELFFQGSVGKSCSIMLCKATRGFVVCSSYERWFN